MEGFGGAGLRGVSGGCGLWRREVGAYCLLVGFSPWYGHEGGFVEPWFLVDECFHEDLDAFETGAAGQGNIRLSARKDTTREINLYLVEGEALTLMNRYRPRQTDGVLFVSANLFLLNLLLNLMLLFPTLRTYGK